jgi:aminopeptidase 2
MDASLAGVIQTWWEDDKVTKQLNAFRRVRPSALSVGIHSIYNRSNSHLNIPQALCSPLVERYGLEYSKDDSADVTQLRTLAIGGAAAAGDPA